MKRVIVFLLVICTPLLHTVAKHEIAVEECWKDLDASERHIRQFGGKWVWSGTIVFKKRGKDPVSLHDLDVTWKGEKLSHLSGSLFKKEPGKQFYPLEDSLVSDGQWKPNEQMLHFHFNHKENLNPVTIFCLVLTIPENLEPKLRKGQFALKQDTLPYAFRTASKKKKLSFSLHPPQTKTHKKIAFTKKQRRRKKQNLRV